MEDNLIILVVLVEIVLFFSFTICLLGALLNKRNDRPKIENPPLLLLNANAFTQRGNKFRKAFLILFLIAVVWPLVLVIVIPSH